jgi:hypothetical protein
MPVAACAVIRAPRRLESRWNASPPISTTSATFDTSNGGLLALISSIPTCRGLAAAFPTRSPPRLLNAAAVGGLEPPSERRLRGAYPHLRHSTAERPALRSWHTCSLLQSGAIRHPAVPGYDPAPAESGRTRCSRPLFTGACPPYRAVMEIPTQRDHVDDEMPRRGRTHIAGSAIAARFGQFGDCPASAGVPCRNGLGYPLAGFCGDR